ncbi:MAG: CRISPR-associated helicase Cas3' [Finegoldia magna]|nr:CRISPR-associated helicase Cas3' [Finegoldia magna]
MLADNFWAKKSESSTGLYKWLPLTQHLLDTEYVMINLWERWLSDNQKKIIDKSLSNGDLDSEKLIKFVALTHDLGKATPAFQLKSFNSDLKDLDNILREKLALIGFEKLEDLKLPDMSMTKHAMASEVILESYGVSEDVASIVGAHHGTPLSSNDHHKLQINTYAENYFQIGSPNSILWEKSQKEIFNWALEKSGYNSIENIPNITQPSAVIVSGLLIMADWISSNEKYFPLIDIEQDSITNLEERLHNGWMNWEKSDLWRVSNEINLETIYDKRFGFKNPRPAQKVLTNTIDETLNPGIIIFEAPMGIGKTEAALVATEQLAYKNRCSGLFFGLPTQATSNGMFTRVNDWLHRMLQASDMKASIRLKHGKAELNDVFNDIAKCVNIDDNINESVIVNEWFSGRKTAVLDDFVVGTVDQFLMLALKQKHLALRHLGFSKKVVVLDEVHAYDTYMSQFLYMAVKWMGAYNIPVVILSATLPSEKRKDLIRNYMEGAGHSWKKLNKPESLCTDSYPLITYNDGDQIKQEINFPKDKNKTKTVTIMKQSSDNIFELVDEIISHDGIIGIIVNTVKKAQELYSEFEKIYGDDLVDVLHSAFIATDRVKKENNLLKMIGKEAVRPNRKIIIGTQVIEQSLDIDFDVLITEIAPMDLLIQRIGRLWRHDIKRPRYFSKPVCYVTGISDNLDFDSGTGFIYDNYILARTQYFLQDSLEIPDDISKLVQNVYSDKEIDFNNNELNSTLNNLKIKHDEFLKLKKLKANTFRLKEPLHESSLFDTATLIDWSNGVCTNLTEETAYAQVRDTNETVEVIALQKIGKGYGLFGNGEDLSSKISDFTVAKEIAKQTITLPIAMTKNYNIDETIRELEKFKIENLSDWQKSQWLKSSLAIIFDENGYVDLQNGFRLHYSKKCGLSYTKRKDVKNGTI